MKPDQKALRLMWKKIAQMDAAYFKQAIPPIGATVSETFYYTDAQDSMQCLEIIRPNDVASKLPVILMTHGGGWVYGHKDSYYRYYAMELSKRGYAVISYNYRLAFDHPFPAVIEDIFNVLAWLVKHAEKEQLAMNELFLVGDSAGAHLSALTALILQNPHLQDVYQVNALNLKVMACGLSCGVYDFDRLIREPYDLPFKDTLVKTIFNQETYQDHPLYPYASVSALLKADFPPCFILSSKADPLFKESEKFLEECKALKIPVKHHFYPKNLSLPHVFNLKSIYPQSACVNAEMLDSFDLLRG